VTGLTGVTGVQGATGVQGSTGVRGNTGVQGATGLTGVTGLTGMTGVQGATGVQGSTGVQGNTGVQGATGLTGVTGVQGITGLGVTGPSGIGSAALKAGTIPAVNFSGNPKTATVTFVTAFSSTAYSITLTGQDGRTWTYESKTTTGFVVNSNANSAPTGETSWKAVLSGEY